jgi:hypothetical protein
LSRVKVSVWAERPSDGMVMLLKAFAVR